MRLLALRALPFFLMLAPACIARAQLVTGESAGNVSNASVDRFQRQLDQFQRETALQANPAIPAGRRALVDYGAYFTAQYLSIDDINHNNHGLRQYDLVPYARVDIDGVHEFFARARLSYLDFNAGDSFDGKGDRFEAFLERAYYRFDLQRSLAAYNGINTGNDFIFKGGRQLVYWANGLTLSQTLDGVVLEGIAGPFDLQVLAGITAIHQTVDFDNSRPSFDTHTSRGFYGASFSIKAGEQHPFVYALFQQDYNHGDTLVTGPIQTRFHYNSYYVGAGSTGPIGDRLLYGAEVVYEGGRGYSNSFSTAGGMVSQIDQTLDPIEAYAADFRLDYVFNDPLRTRLGAELIFATGDGDRLNTTNTLGGNAPHSKDHAFNAFGLLNTGLAFAPEASNLYILRVGASTFPLSQTRAFRNLQIGTDFFVYRKADNQAPIDEPTSDHAFLGVEPDVYINWQIRSDLTLALRYGAFFPNHDAVTNHDVRQFIYAGLTFAF